MTDVIRKRPPMEVAQVSLAQAALLIDQASRAMAEAGSQADAVAPNRFRNADLKGEVAQTLRYEVGELTLDHACRMAQALADTGAQVHDWAASLANYNDRRQKPEEKA